MKINKSTKNMRTTFFAPTRLKLQSDALTLKRKQAAVKARATRERNRQAKLAAEEKDYQQGNMN